MTDYKRLLELYELADNEYYCEGDYSGYIRHDENDKAFYAAAYAAIPELVRENQETLRENLEMRASLSMKNEDLIVDNKKLREALLACAQLRPEIERLRAINKQQFDALAKNPRVQQEELDRLRAEVHKQTVINNEFYHEIDRLRAKLALVKALTSPHLPEWDVGEIRAALEGTSPEDKL